MKRVDKQYLKIIEKDDTVSTGSLDPKLVWIMQIRTNVSR
jgi:hypothetical protein